ncbi:MAG: helix-turn-helix transcriptional regulator [Gammaproteobacteria bacterium]|nr:helix-turn-helix transcriptional regulator [Gammaproteobacteria bacterium]
MAIVVNLDVMLARRKMRAKELAAAIGITAQNLSILKTGKARAIRFSTLDALCRILACQPADLIEYRDDAGTGQTTKPTRPS